MRSSFVQKFDELLSHAIGAARASLPFACRGSRSAERPVRRESRGGEAPRRGAGGGEECGGRVSASLRRSIQGIGTQGFVASANSLACRRGNRTRSVARGGGCPKGRR